MANFWSSSAAIIDPAPRETWRDRRLIGKVASGFSGKMPLVPAFQNMTSVDDAAP
jgi:hypothetical protein